MEGEITIYWVILCKDNKPVYPVAGPFVNSDVAHAAMTTSIAPNGRCYLEVMESKLEVKQ